MRSHNYFDANLRTIQSGNHIRIKDFYDRLPPEISRDDAKSVAQYVADRFAEIQDLRFSYRSHYTLSKRARGHLSSYANAEVYHFTCSQRECDPKPSLLPYGKTRNRRRRIQTMACQGKIQVTIFPDDIEFDIAVDFDHSHIHQGREHYGVPRSVRQWIHDNPRNSPHEQRRELMAAISRGEIVVPKKKYLSTTNVFYWWRKMYKEKQYASKDPWENATHILQNHELVSRSPISH